MLVRGSDSGRPATETKGTAAADKTAPAASDLTQLVAALRSGMDEDAVAASDVTSPEPQSGLASNASYAPSTQSAGQPSPAPEPAPRRKKKSRSVSVTVPVSPVAEEPTPEHGVMKKGTRTTEKTIKVPAKATSRLRSSARKLKNAGKHSGVSSD